MTSLEDRRASRARGTSIAAAMLLLAWSRQANATLSFSPFQCPSPVYVPYTYSLGQRYPDTPGGDTSRRESEVGYDPNNYSAAVQAYNNTINHSRYFIGNQYTSSMEFHYTLFDLEYFYDTIRGGHYTNYLTTDWVQDFSQTGSYSAGYLPAVVGGGGDSLQAHHGYLQFVSDINNSHQGITVDSVKVTCGAYDILTHAMWPHERYSGVLLAQNDVVYARVASDTPASGTHQTVALWTAPSVDADLYVRCNAYPTPTVYDYRDFRGGTSSFIHIPANQCVGGSWYIAVHSYSGVGQFSLVWARHKTSEHRTINVSRGDSGNSAPADRESVMRDMLRRAAGRVFGMTEGQVVLADINLHNAGTSGCLCTNPGLCDTVLDWNRTFRANAEICPFVYGGSYSNVCAHVGADDISNARDEVLAHEWGHEWLCNRDEYTDALGPACGHSIMASYRNMQNVCQNSDHAKDGQPGATDPYGVSGWARMSTDGRLYWAPWGGTPDAFEYLYQTVDGNIPPGSEENFNFDNPESDSTVGKLHIVP